MVTILEEARIRSCVSLSVPSSTTIGLLIHEVNISTRASCDWDSPLQVTMWSKRVRAVDFTVGYEVRSVSAPPDSKPSVIAETSWPPCTSKSNGCNGFRPSNESICSAGRDEQS